METSSLPFCLRRGLFAATGGIFFAISFSFMPPAGNFLSAAKESYQRTPTETHGFCTSFPVCKSYILTPAETGN